LLEVFFLALGRANLGLQEFYSPIRTPAFSIEVTNGFWFFHFPPFVTRRTGGPLSSHCYFFFLPLTLPKLLNLTCVSTPPFFFEFARFLPLLLPGKGFSSGAFLSPALT